MKTMKKTLSIIIAVAMLFALCANAFAAPATYKQYKEAGGLKNNAEWTALTDSASATYDADYANLDAEHQVKYDAYKTAGGTKTVADWNQMETDNAGYFGKDVADQIKFDAYQAAGGSLSITEWTTRSGSTGQFVGYGDLTAAEQVQYDEYVHTGNGDKTPAAWKATDYGTVPLTNTTPGQEKITQEHYDQYQEAGGTASANDWAASMADATYYDMTPANQAKYDQYKTAGGAKTPAEWMAASTDATPVDPTNPSSATYGDEYSALNPQKQKAYDDYVAAVNAYNQTGDGTTPYADGDDEFQETKSPAAWSADGNPTGPEASPSTVRQHTIEVDASTAGPGGTPLTGHDFDAYQIFTGTVDYTADPATLSIADWGNGIDGPAMLAALAAAWNNGAPVENPDGTVTVTTPGGTFDLSKTMLERLAPATTATEFGARLDKYDVDGNGSKDDAGDLKPLSDVQSVELAKLLREFKKATGKVDVQDINNNGHYTALVPDGYWLVVDETVVGDKENDFTSANILKVVKDVTEIIKGSVPTVEKGVSDTKPTNMGTAATPGTTNLKDTTKASIGDKVWFTLRGTTSSKVSDFDDYYYAFIDTLSEGLTVDENSVEVWRDDNVNITDAFVISLEDELADLDNNPSTPDEATGRKILKIVCNDMKTATYGDPAQKLVTDLDPSGNPGADDSMNNRTLTVYYSATLNNKAVIGGEGNKNEVKLEYSNNPDSDDKGESTPDDTSTFTFELDIQKVDKEGVQLPGAEFVLYRIVPATGGVFNVEFATVDADNKLSGWIPGAEALTTASLPANYAIPSGVSTLTTGPDGGTYTTIEVEGLKDGVYYLRETKAPNGYDKLTSDITVNITATVEKTSLGTYDVTSLTAVSSDNDGMTTATVDPNTDIITDTVINTNDLFLPETGGIGTTIFYIAGTILVLGAGVLLVTRRKVAVR